jgi:hypothetical protein
MLFLLRDTVPSFTTVFMLQVYLLSISVYAHANMRIFQNHWVSGPYASSGILKTRKHGVSETELGSVLR